MSEWASVLPRIVTPVPSWTCTRGYPGTLDQVGEARRFLGRLLDGCPAAADAALLCSELCANSVQYSRSRAAGGQFSVHMKVRLGRWVWTGVEDQGGPWRGRPRDTERMHGLDIVGALAGDDCWGVVDGAAAGAGGRLVWFRLGWAAAPARGSPARVTLAC